jgi:hypothetical protein
MAQGREPSPPAFETATVSAALHPGHGRLHDREIDAKELPEDHGRRAAVIVMRRRGAPMPE